jgi:transcriptional regulator of acetoin/glycerol metabolism
MRLNSSARHDATNKTTIDGLSEMTHIVRLSDSFTQMNSEANAQVHLRVDPSLLYPPPIRPLCEVEKEAILHAYQLTRNPCLAAKALGIGKTTMYRKMHKYGITPFSALGRL